MTFADLRLRRLAAIGFALLAACSTDPVDPPPDDELDAPTGVTVQATSSTTATVSWSAVPDATSYRVERAQGAASFVEAGNSTTTSFNDSGLNPNTTYRYRVRASNASASSEFSGEANVVTPPPEVPTVEVTADITANTTWGPPNVYVLKGFIHVANGATLTIQPGTKIIGDFSTVGSSLFVLRGAQINAQGTAQNPIVFTSSRTEGQRQAGDWGGLIIVGNGIINRGVPVILEGTGTTGNPEVDYSGGNNNADNSGILRYVRVEFAGYATAPDQELNSFTFAAVGSGTQCDHLQSLNGLDDSFEFFGGAMDCFNLVSYNSGDDHFDMSEGYLGRLQYVIAFQTRQVIPRPAAGNVSSDPQGIENDGCAGANCNNGQTSLPFNVPLVANFTLVGPPATVDFGSGGSGMMLRRGTGGYYVNGVIARWGRAGFSLRDQTTLDRIGDGNLLLRNILVMETPLMFQPAAGGTVQGEVDLNANSIEDLHATPVAGVFLNVPGAEPANGAVLDWEPPAASPAADGGTLGFPAAVQAKAAGVIVPTLYRGAAGPLLPKWWAGWTYFAVN